MRSREELLLIFLSAKTYLEMVEREPELPNEIRNEIRKALDEDDSKVFANRLVSSIQMSGLFGWPPVWTGDPISKYGLLDVCIDIPTEKAAATADIVEILQAYKKMAGKCWRTMEVHPNSVTTERERIRRMVS
jgi:hypothetical protein